MSEFQPFELIDGDYGKGFLLLCDHARNTLPEKYGNLGLPEVEFDRHIAYDIGAEAIARGLAEQLNVPMVMSCFSRLLIDPNRGVDDPTLIRQLSDGTIIPGNYPLSAEELEIRTQNFYKPYHQAIESALKTIVGAGQVPMILAVHTMTDRWNGITRDWQMSWLFDSDTRLLDEVMKEMGEIEDVTIGLNEPYDGALGGDSMYQHGTLNGYAHLLLEVRQDLVSSQEGVDEWVNLLAPILEKVNHDPLLHQIKHFGSRAI